MGRGKRQRGGGGEGCSTVCWSDILRIPLTLGTGKDEKEARHEWKLYELRVYVCVCVCNFFCLTSQLPSDGVAKESDWP